MSDASAEECSPASHRRLRRAALWTGVCLLAVGTPAHGQLTRTEVEAVRFEGNSTFPPDSLARAILTQETDCRSAVLQPFCWLGFGFALRRTQLRERELPGDQARLILWYQLRGFFDVQVDTPVVTRAQGKADVLFRITEGRPVVTASIDFTGADDLEATDLIDDLPLQAGDRFSRIARDATRDSIVQRLRNRGYAYASVYPQVLRPAQEPYSAQVTFEIVSGPVSTYGALDITGIEELSQGTVRRTLQFNSGDIYRDQDIEDARARLFGLEIVRSARVEPDLSTTDSIVPVNVVVQEADARRVRAGGGWNTAECLNLEARWASRNFLGGARTLQVRGRLGNLLAADLGDAFCNDSGTGDYARLTWVAAVDLSQPFVFSTNNALTTSIFAERQTLPDIFIRRAIGLQAGLTRFLDPRTPMTFLYRPELSELDASDVLFCTGFLVCTPQDIGLLEGANWLAPVGLSINRDRSDDLLNPRSGHRLSLDLEHAAPWTGSSFRYDRAVLEATSYGSLGGPVVLATRARGGWVGSGAFEALRNRPGETEIVHPQRRFYAGGANSVRGFAQSRLGPRVLIVDPARLVSAAPGGAGCTPTEVMDLSCDPGVARGGIFSPLPTGGTRVLEGNVEVRFPFASWLEGVAFTDVGQAWGPNERARIGDLEATPGFGLRFPSPVGPIRVDLAYRSRGAQELGVITTSIQDAGPGDDMDDWLRLDDNTQIPYVRTNQLALLDNTVFFLEPESRWQLHISIGQAF